MPMSVSKNTPEIWCLELAAPRDMVDAAARALSDAPFPQALAVSQFELGKGDAFQLRVLYEGKPPAARIISLLEPVIAALPFTLLPLAPTDWVRKSQEGLKPVRAGRLLITTKAHETDAPPGALPILIEAGLAFGTGHHATTMGCLLALEWLAKSRAIRNPLDLGCGSGVLGIAAAKLWRCKVWVSDIDPIAVETARANARINDVSPLIKAVTANGVRHPRLVGAGPFDLVSANILARPLVKLAPALAQIAAPGGIVILSGLLKTQENWVRNAYGHQGLALRHRIILDDWSTLILAR